MGDKLNQILKSLTNIKNNLRKLNYERQKLQIVQSKLDKANIIYLELNNKVTEVNKRIKDSEVDAADIIVIKNTVDEIKKIYQDIVGFKSYIKNKSVHSLKMSSFDLKVAKSLLPVLDDSENTTLKLIESAQFYYSFISGEDKPMSIKFSLKTRLSNNAKLRLKSNYESMINLLNDIKIHLLTKKSDIALQTKLFSVKQNEIYRRIR